MRLCSGCQTKVPDAVRFCASCSAERSPKDGIKQHRVGEYNDELDALRKSPQWQKLRRRVVSEEPFCRRCKNAMTEIVDHIIPAGIAIAQVQESGRWIGKNAGYFLRSNLQGLCRPCHGIKTLEDKAHVGPWPNVVEEYDKAPKKVWSF